MFRRTLIAAIGAITLAAATLAPAQAATYKVTASAPATADVGTLFKITGKSSAKKTLTIQQYSGSRWKSFTTVKTASNGTYVRSVKMPSLGAKKYRVVAPAAGSVKTGVSPTLTVTGYTWLAMASQPHLSGGYQNWDVTARVASTSYARSVQYAKASDSSAFNYLNLGGRCNRVAFGVALDDLSGTDVGQEFSATVRGDFGSGLDYNLTESSAATRTLVKYDKEIPLQIKTLIFSAYVTSGAVIAITSPRAHCSVAKLPPMPLIG